MDAADAASPPTFTPRPGAADPFALRLVRELPHDRGALSCCYDPSGRYLFAGARDLFVHRWDLAAEPLVPEPQPKAKTPPLPQAPADSRLPLAGHESWVGAMQFLADGKHLATGDFVGRLIVWPALEEQPEPLFSVEAHQGSIRALATSPDGALIATVGNDHAVRVWSATTGEKVLDLVGHDCHVYNTAFHPSGQALVSADLKGVVRHWEIPSGKLIRSLDASVLYTWSEKYTVDVGGVRGMAFSPDGSLLACSGSIGEDRGIAIPGLPRVLLLDWATGKTVRELQGPVADTGFAWSVVFHPDRFLIASGGARRGGYLWFWTPDAEASFHQHAFAQKAPGFDLALAPDGLSLAVANHDGVLRLYEMFVEPEPPEPPRK
ncbi:WD40 repeat domain-containing protein [Lignipirellula cremea]|uniref:WD domain, G-beta repeat n=1 Tax=Lignipirellula cremea TaxID=2528010 RepID=A0A518DNT6_9BACT|nr:WD40 repeat domain-containing protein [Lignipirellula cremea]QDU93491.1 WD domain, G-beta repeat [Lignipirellula cremea]